MKTDPIRLRAPFTRDQTRRLNAGDVVRLSGRILTGRDRLHKHLAETHASPITLEESAIFHCGPIVQALPDGTWRVVAAGPTTSIREEPYMATIIAEQGVTVIIGKGGMGSRTLAACHAHGCVYLQAVGGAAAVIAQAVTAVEGVHFLDTFGPTEAMWSLAVDGLEAVVGIDTHGNSLYAAVEAASARRLDAILGRKPGTREP